MKLSVIIVNYNVKYFLEQALLAVRKASQNLAVEVFVVDNNSVDESVAMVRNKFPEVKLIANKHNPGFSIANNQAIRISTGEYVLLLNPDTVVEEDTFSKCLQFMDQRPEAGGLGVKMIDGSGNFLPESKRGFPSPAVAFYKTFGLSKIFPTSKTFNHYHLGYLDQNENHEVEVLAGAFMLLRKSVLEEIGLLDEAFFMYGEDIDLSYRIVQAGYKNYYLADTQIIHYKGESTKKGSLNYVKTFYNAMIIFAQKHFKGEQASSFILMLRAAIYFRALLSLVKSFVQKSALIVLDALLIFVGMYFLKDYWATHYFNDPNYYEPSFLYFNVPLYISIWLTAAFFSGAYDEDRSIRRLVRGFFIGTVFIAAVYGFLDMEYRTSRVLIILGAIWATVAAIGVRLLWHFYLYRNFNLGRQQVKNLVIVGAKEESKRVLQLLHQAQVQTNFIGTVSPADIDDDDIYLNNINQLAELVHIYKINEIIFCSKDISAQAIMYWMTNLGNSIGYKIVPTESLSIIGSSSKNAAGELYTIEIRFQIAEKIHRRNKRLFDIMMALSFLLSFPLVFLFVKNKWSFFKNIFATLFGRKSWVGYCLDDLKYGDLPIIKTGVLNTTSGLKLQSINQQTKQRLNFLYAKDYATAKDLDIIWNAWRNLGN
ncbi:MAG: glycosyltransferase [Saprospiraceae bacterium]